MMAHPAKGKPRQMCLLFAGSFSDERRDLAVTCPGSFATSASDQQTKKAVQSPLPGQRGQAGGRLSLSDLRRGGSTVARFKHELVVLTVFASIDAKVVLNDELDQDIDGL